MIEIEGVSRRYGDTMAVSGVSTRIGRGEIVGLLGHNGAGKTTLMKMLTGYIEPSEGSLRVGGCDVVADRTGAQRHIGYLPESAPLYPEMLVQDYLLMMAELRGVSPDRLIGAVGRAAAATGLGQRMVTPIGHLSKGYRQRVGIAQAIVHDPAVLVLDEPTNGLDPEQIQSIRTLIRDLGTRTTVLLSTHILQEVEAVCQRVLVLIDGRLVEDAPLDKLLAARAVRMSVHEASGGVEARLRQVPGVRDVRRVGPDASLPGFNTWTINVDDAAQAAPALLRSGVDAGWTLGAVAPEVVTLESVFRRLQAAAAGAPKEVA